MTKQNSKKEQATATATVNTGNEQATVNTGNEQATVNTGNEQATVNELVNATLELSTEEFASLCNRLSLKQLSELEIALKERAKAELNKAEKAILERFKIEENEKSIAAASLLLSADGATVESVNSLPVVFFNQLFNAAVASLSPAPVETGKAAKHNDITHKFMLSVACYAYKKEPNADNFVKQSVQSFEPLTLADFAKHCEKNTFANNTVYPLVIDGVKYDDKKSAVAAMAELMYNWYINSVNGATVAPATGE